MRNPTLKKHAPVAWVAIVGLIVTLFAPVGLSAAGLSSPVSGDSAAGSSSPVSDDSSVGSDSPVADDSAVVASNTSVRVEWSIVNDNGGTRDEAGVSAWIGESYDLSNGAWAHGQLPVGDTIRFSGLRGSYYIGLVCMNGAGETVDAISLFQDPSWQLFFAPFERPEDGVLDCALEFDDWPNDVSVTAFGRDWETVDDFVLYLDDVAFRSGESGDLMPGTYEVTYDSDRYEVLRFRCDGSSYFSRPDTAPWTVEISYDPHGFACWATVADRSETRVTFDFLQEGPFDSSAASVESDGYFPVPEGWPVYLGEDAAVTIRTTGHFNAGKTIKQIDCTAAGETTTQPFAPTYIEPGREGVRAVLDLPVGADAHCTATVGPREQTLVEFELYNGVTDRGVTEVDAFRVGDVGFSNRDSHLFDPGTYQLTTSAQWAIKYTYCEDYFHGEQIQAGLVAREGFIELELPEGLLYAHCFVELRPAASVKIVHNVVNDDGGTATSVGATASLEPSYGHDITLSNNEYVSVPSGTYQLDADLAGYATRLARCVDQTTGSELPITNGEIDVPAGASVICVAIHNDIETQLMVASRVQTNNDGVATDADVSLTLDGNSVASDAWNTVQPGANVISFTHLPDYEVQNITCTNRRDGTQLPTTIDPNTGDLIVDVPTGSLTRCVIRQNDLVAKLKVIPIVRDAHKQLVDPSPVQVVVDGNGFPSNQPVIVTPGPHTVEANLPGYNTTAFRCNVTHDNNGPTITNGDYTICVINLRPE